MRLSKYRGLLVQYFRRRTGVLVFKAFAWGEPLKSGMQNLASRN